MKKIIITLLALLTLTLALAFSVSAQEVYLEQIPNELKMTDDTVTHFVVFEEEKYFTGSGSTINGLNTEAMEADMSAKGIDTTKLGTEYLIRYNFPATLGGNTVTNVNLNAFKSNSYFSTKCGYIQFEGTVSSTSDMRDNCSQLRCLDFGENSQMNSIPVYFCDGAHKLLSIKNFPKELSAIGVSAFRGCCYAFKGDIYINATEIGEYAFDNTMANVTSITFGPLTQKIGQQCFCVRMAEVSAGSKPSDSKIQVTKIEFMCDVTQMTIASGAFYFGGTWARAEYSNLTEIVLSHVDNERVVTSSSVFNDFTSNGNVLFDEDATDDFVVAYHDFSICTSISYSNFLEKGTKTFACSKCGANTQEDCKALFICLGYSITEYGSEAVSVSFVVNKSAVQEYTATTGKSLQYGVFAVSQEKLGTNDVFASDGNASSGVASTEMSNRNFDIFAFRIVGFETDEYKAINMAMGAYVIETEGAEKSISYMQAEKALGDKYSFASYNSIKEKLN